MVEMKGEDCFIRIIDFGKSKYEGEILYPGLTEENIKNSAQIVSALLPAGVCSAKTDLYPFGTVLDDTYCITKCQVYKRLGELLCLNEAGDIEHHELLDSNCDDCGGSLNNSASTI